MPVPVFIYHSLHTRPEDLAALPPPEGRYSLPLAQFRRHLEWLSANGFQSVAVPLSPCPLVPLSPPPLVPLSPPPPLSPSPTPAVALTFDDGHVSNYRHAFPLIASRGWRATFFIVAGWIGRPGRLTASQLREMTDAGMSIGSHTLTHARLSELDRPQLDRELAQSKQVLEDILGSPVGAIALPGGAGSRLVIDRALAAGYTAVCTSVPGWTPRPPLVPRLSITSHTTERRFRALASSSAVELAAVRAAWLARQALKRVIGLGAYERALARTLARRYNATCR